MLIDLVNARRRTTFEAWVYDDVASVELLSYMSGPESERGQQKEWGERWLEQIWRPEEGAGALACDDLIAPSISAYGLSLRLSKPASFLAPVGTAQVDHRQRISGLANW